MEDLPTIRGPPPPRRFAGPGRRPLLSALRRAWAWAGQRRRRRSRAPAGGLPQAEAGGRAAAAPLRRWGSGCAACQGRGWAGTAINSLEPGPRLQPRPLSETSLSHCDPSSEGDSSPQCCPAVSGVTPFSRIRPLITEVPLCPCRPEEELQRPSKSVGVLRMRTPNLGTLPSLFLTFPAWSLTPPLKVISELANHRQAWELSLDPRGGLPVSLNLLPPSGGMEGEKILSPARCAHACNYSTSEVEAGGSVVQGHPQLYAEFEVHRTLPTTSVQHGSDLRESDRSATSRSSWPSLAPCPPHASASHSVSKISCNPQGRLPPKRRHERLSSSMVPGYTGFVPQAKFIFAKNCNQVWAEALSDFTPQHGVQESHELPKETKGEKEIEEEEELEAEAAEAKQEMEQASPYSMDDADPQKFFMSGFTGYVPRARFLFGSSFPVLTNQALLEFGQKRSQGRAQKDPKAFSPLPRPNLPSLGLLPHYGGYVPGYKFQFGRTFGHLTHDALGLSTSQKQLPA